MDYSTARWELGGGARRRDPFGPVGRSSRGRVPARRREAWPAWLRPETRGSDRPRLDSHNPNFSVPRSGGAGLGKAVLAFSSGGRGVTAAGRPPAPGPRLTTLHAEVRVAPWSPEPRRALQVLELSAATQSLRPHPGRGACHPQGGGPRGCAEPRPPHGRATRLRPPLGGGSRPDPPLRTPAG